MRRSAKTGVCNGARYVEVRLRGLALERQGRVILDDVSWTVRPGQKWVLAGGNGAGKTQLLKIIAGAVWLRRTTQQSRLPRLQTVRAVIIGVTKPSCHPSK